MGEGVIWLWYLYGLYIFLYVDCFEWGGHLALISIWSLYILISSLFKMGEGVIWLWYLYGLYIFL